MVDAEQWVAADTVATQVTARILQNAFNGSPRPRPRQSNSYEAARQADGSQAQVNPALHKLVSHPPTWGVSHTLFLSLLGCVQGSILCISIFLARNA